MRFDGAINARLWRTLWYQQNPREFIRQLRRELLNHEFYCEDRGLKAACRLDGTSDLSWDREHPDLFEDFEDIQFYGYTKVPAKMGRFLRGETPANYHLCFSRSETSENHYAMRRFLQDGGTATVLFRNRPFPETYNGFPVIDGTLDDRRWLDPPGHIIGLDPLGSMRHTTSGFVVDNPGEERCATRRSGRVG